jgi:gamma-glutamylaminecyclotransferase
MDRAGFEKVFAIGTLKRGFPFHERGLAAARFLGHFRSVKAYPLVIAGPWFAPMILDEPGVGHRIEGELYEVDDVGLARLDRLESIGVPGNFRRPIEVESIDGNVKFTPFVFMKAAELATPIHSGYLVSYQDRRFIVPEHRGDAS